MANEFKVKKGLIVHGSGSAILDVRGSQGQLFSVTDSLSGSLFSVGDISGVPIIDVRSDAKIGIGTSIPAEKLHVYGGNIKFGDSHFIGDDSFDNLHILASSGENVVIQAPSGNSIDLKTAGGSTLNLDSSQNAIFAGNVSMVNGNATGKFAVKSTGVHGSFDFYNDGTSYLNGAVTVDAALSITAGALSITADGSNAATLTESSAGILTIATVDDFRVDAGGDITLDAAGNDVRFKDSDTTYGYATNESNNFVLGAGVQDKDIIFRGNDGGTLIDALTLDMSNGGSATFRDDVDINSGVLNLTKQNGSPTINMLRDSTNPGTNTLLHYLNFKVDYDGSHQDWGGIEHRTNASSVRTDLRFNVKSTSGNVQTGLAVVGQPSIGPRVGIGVTSPTATLHIVDASNSGVTSLSANDRIKLSGDGVITWGASANYGTLTWDTGKAIVASQGSNRLHLATSGNSDALVLNGGRVGIAHSDPYNGTRVHIAGEDTTPTFNTTAIDDTTLVLSNSDVAYGTVFGTFGTGDGVIQQRRMSSAVYYDLNLNPYGGNVGIGTTDPQDQLHVQSTLRVGPYFSSNDRDHIRLVPHGTDTRIQSPNERFHIENFAGHIIISASAVGGVGIANEGADVTAPSASLHVKSTTGDVLLVEGSGSTILDVQGSQGQLFSVSDQLTGSLFKVADISGIPVFEAFDDDRVIMGAYGQNTLYVKGSSGLGSGSVGINTAPSHLNTPLHVVGVGTSAANIRIGRDDGISTGKSITFAVSSTVDATIDADANKIRLIPSGSGPSFEFNKSGAIKFSGYGSGTHSGTAAKTLAVDSSGNVIEITGGGTIDGSGTANKIVKWSDSDTITDSIIFESSNKIGIGTTSPDATLQVGATGTNGGYSIMIEGNFGNSALASNPRLNFIDTNFGITAGEYSTVSTKDALGIFGYQGSGRGILFAHTTAGSTTHLKDMRHDMFIAGDTGNVGIGTTSPDELLHVFKPTSGDATIKIETVTGGDPSIILNSAASNRSGLIKYQDNGTNIGRIEYVHNGDKLQFQAGSATGQILELTNSAATITGDITTSGNIILSGASNEIIKSNGSIRLNIDSDNNQTDRIFIVSTGANSELFRVDESGKGTFQGDVIVSGTNGLKINTTADLQTSAERFTLNGLGVIRNSSDSAASLYIQNHSTTANTIQPYIFLSDNGGNRGGLGVETSTAIMSVNGQGGLKFQTGASGVGGTEALLIDNSQNAKFAGNVYLGGDTNAFAAKIYKKTVTINGSSLTTVATVEGNNLSSAIRLVATGTSGNVVIGTIADIIVNHSQDILIKTTNTFYRKLTIKIISNNNEDFAIQLKRDGDTTNDTNVQLEITPLNSEVVTFTNSHSFTGASLEHLSEYGTKLSSNDNNANFHDLYMEDNARLYFGAAPDFELKHNSTTNVNHISSKLDRQLSLNANIINLTNQANNDTVMSVSGSRVGLKTTSPSRTLHVAGPGGSSGGIMIAPSSGDAEIQFQDSGVTNAYITLDDGTQDLNFRDDSATVMTIDFGSERVGIGTASPGNKLEVKSSGADDGIYLVKSNSGNLLGGVIQTGSGDGALVARNTSNNQVVLLRGNGNSYINGGNLGIGTTSPNHKLDIQVDSNVALRLHRFNSALDTTEPIGIGFSHRSDTASSTTDTRAGIFSSYNGDLFFSVDQGGRVDDDPIADAAMFIDGAAGRVGIGTISPGGNLHITGNSGEAAQLYLSDIDNGGGVNDALLITKSGTSAYVYNRDSGDLGLGSNDSNSMLYVKSTGNVGIGTNNPGHLLEVRGTGDAVSVGNDTNNSTYIRFANTRAFVGYTGFNACIQAGSGKGIMFNVNNNTFNNGTAMFIKSDGMVGIGLTTPTEKLAVNGNIETSGNTAGLKIGFNVGDSFSFNSTTVAHYGMSNAGNVTAGGVVLSGYFGIRFASQGNIRGHISQAGQLTMANDVVAFGSPSDKSLKENIKPINNALDKVKNLKGVTFKWKEAGLTNLKEDIGFIAQDVQEVLPELVRENEDGKLSLRDKGIIPMLVEAVKELSAEVESLKKQLNK